LLVGGRCRQEASRAQEVSGHALARSGVFERLAHALSMADRERAGRDASPTAAVVDAQAARSGGVGVAGWRGFDPARRVVGRKRHALTDTDGRLLLAAVSPANLHDSHGGVALLRASRRPWPFLARCYADCAYTGERVGHATSVALTIVGASQDQKGFAVHPRRWVIERTFGWIGRCRRLARDHEATPSSALAFLVLAAAMVLVRRLARAF
jgi:transposase